ncbi:DUF6461 domain-containing protein [Streptomyces californicus]|uniref:DUF6461 domain-containing protein n=1 Tax=Streptomyces californicus TaxID=67351 RepID=UPI0012FE9138|nr:DUF6461 domain-containing protein [Streptomyces californicus]QRV59512.1 hypothetical protein I6J40_35270 [Streptomyces californicus]
MMKREEMSGSWSLSDSIQFCLTISLNKSPEEVMRAYGADAGRAQLLTAERLPEIPLQGTLLRVGSLGRWSFGIDYDYHIGSKGAVMRDLSAGGESLILYQTAKALKCFDYVVDGKIVEHFEPGEPRTARGQSVHQFSQQVEELVSAGFGAIDASLRAAVRRTGHELTADHLRGPLLSVVIEDPDFIFSDRLDVQLPFPEMSRVKSRQTGRRL